MKTEDLLRYENLMRQMRQALGTPLIEVAYSNQVDGPRSKGGRARSPRASAPAEGLRAEGGG